MKIVSTKQTKKVNVVVPWGDVSDSEVHHVAPAKVSSWLGDQISKGKVFFGNVRLT